MRDTKDVLRSSIIILCEFLEQLHNVLFWRTVILSTQSKTPSYAYFAVSYNILIVNVIKKKKTVQKNSLVK